MAEGDIWYARGLLKMGLWLTLRTSIRLLQYQDLGFLEREMNWVVAGIGPFVLQFAMQLNSKN